MPKSDICLRLSDICLRFFYFSDLLHGIHTKEKLWYIVPKKKKKKVACSGGVFWAGESLFNVRVVVSAVFDSMTGRLHEANRNSNPPLFGSFNMALS